MSMRNKEKNDKRKVVREIIVRRRSLEKLAKLPLMEKYRDLAAKDLIEFSRENGLEIPLLLRQF